MRAWLGEALEAIGLMMIMLGFLIGIGVLALAAFLLVIIGAILLTIGYPVLMTRAERQTRTLEARLHAEDYQAGKTLSASSTTHL